MVSVVFDSFFIVLGVENSEMNDEFGIAIVGLLILVCGALKIAFGGFDGLFAVAIGVVMVYAGVDGIRIKPMPY